MTFYQGLTFSNHTGFKVGWGKGSDLLPPSLPFSVHYSVTRDMYIGKIEDFKASSEVMLKRDFNEFYDIEVVNCLGESKTLPVLILYLICSVPLQ